MKTKPFLKLLSVAVISAIAFCACNNIAENGSTAATDQAPNNGATKQDSNSQEYPTNQYN